MPTYQYSCNDCGAQHDIVQSMSDPTLTECPACGGSMRKLFGNVGVVFKGSGFYRTDSREKKSSGSSGAKSNDKSGSTDSKSSSDSATSTSNSSSSTSTSSGSSTSSSNSTSKPAATSS